MSENFDIIKLIEKNPIARLSQTYQNKLLEKIKTVFNDSQQQLFVGSFYCYLNYNSKNDFVIDFDKIWKWVGFSRKDPAKRLLENNFTQNIDYKILLHQSVERNKNDRGGNNKETILITINTFKKFCLKAGTKKADEIHDYYIKLEEILHEVVNEETDELRNQLTLKDKEIIDIKNNNKNQEKVNRHNILIEKMRYKRCVYIGEIEDNKFIKIGSSKETNERNKQLKKLFGNLIFLDMFECDNFREVEESILANTEIKKHLYREPINGHVSQEVVKLSNDFTYNQLLTIVKKYVNNIQFLTPVQLLEKQKLDLEQNKIDFEKQKLEYNLLLNIINNDKYNNTVSEILQDKLPSLLDNIKNNQTILNNKNNTNDIKLLEQKIENNNNNKDIEEEIENKINHFKIKGRQPKGRKIQKIDPDNLQKIIKVYDSMIYLLRSPENLTCQKSSVQTAIKNNTIYKNFRWNFVNENDDENVSTVLPTKKLKCKPSIISTILKLNNTKTEILGSYATKEEILKTLKMSKITLKNIILNNTLHNDNYYIEYHNCPQNLLDKYNKPINKNISKNCKQVKQINPNTKEVLIFNNLNDIYIKYGFCSKTIQDAIINKNICYGFIWENV
jgi:hypothetical protein